jgi:hypothetical protein
MPKWKKLEREDQAREEMRIVGPLHDHKKK